MGVRATKVLLVDDDRDLRELAHRALLRIGLHKDQIEEAADGQAAYEKATEEVFKIIVIDIDMPRCDGIRATKGIRKKGKNTETTIIAYTSNVNNAEDSAQIQKYKEIGFTDAIPKDPDVLKATLKKYL